MPGGKKVTVDFLKSAISNISTPIWVQDDNSKEAWQKLIHACDQKNMSLKTVDLQSVWPMDLQELFNSLSHKGGVIVFKGLENAHEYIEAILMGILRYYEYRYSSLTDPIGIPQNWKLVIITRTRFYLRDREVYNKLFKIYSDESMNLERTL